MTNAGEGRKASQYLGIGGAQFYTSLLMYIGAAFSFLIIEMIISYVMFETSYDKFWANAEKIYRVSSRYELSGRPDFLTVKSSPWMAEYVNSNLDGQAIATRIDFDKTNIQVEGEKIDARIMFVDRNFLKVFGAEGYLPQIIDEDRIFITSTLMDRLPDLRSGEGKVLGLDNENIPVVFAGEIPEFPDNSHLNVEAIVFSKSKESYWDNIQRRPLDITEKHITYVRLFEKKNYDSLRILLNRVEGEINSSVEAGAIRSHFDIEPIKDIYLHHIKPDSYKRDGNLNTILVLISIGALIFVSALMSIFLGNNQRHSDEREVIYINAMFGLGKFRFICAWNAREVLKYCGIGLLANLMFLYSHSFVEGLFGIKFAGYLQTLIWFFAIFTAFVGISLVVNTVILSRLYRGMETGEVEAEKIIKSFDLISSCVLAVQLVSGLAAMSMAFAIDRQLSFATRDGLNYSLEDVWVLWTGKGDLSDRKQLIERLKNLPGVLEVGEAFMVPTDDADYVSDTRLINSGSVNNISLSIWPVTPEYIDLMEFKLLAGRNFRQNYSDTPDNEVPVDKEGLITRLVAKQLGFFEPEDAVGQLIYNMWENPTDPAVIRIVGVIEDFRARPVNRPEEGFLFYYSPIAHKRVVLKLDQASSFAALEPQFRELVEFYHPDKTYDGSWMADRLVEANEAIVDQLVVTRLVTIVFFISFIFSTLAYAMRLVSLNLRALAIRVVLGASRLQCVGTVLVSEGRKVLVALTLGVALSAILLESWLSLYSVRTGFPALEIFLASLVYEFVFCLIISVFVTKSLRSRLLNALHDL